MAERLAWNPLPRLWDAASATLDNQLARAFDVVSRLQARTSVTLSANATLTEAHDVVLVDTAGGSVTITLPLAARVRGFSTSVKKLAAANTLTVQRSGSDTIDGATTSAWTTQHECRTFVSCIVTPPGTWGWVVI